MEGPVLSLGTPCAKCADAARNRLHLLATAREMLAEQGADTLTMDAQAARAGLGKGTVFRRFGTRAGIFHALLDDDERILQEQVLAGPLDGPLLLYLSESDLTEAARQIGSGSRRAGRTSYSALAGLDR